MISVTLALVAMFFLSWPITLVGLVLLPDLRDPGRGSGRRLADITRESYTLNAQMNNTMTERFNVSGALLVKLFGRPNDEARRLREQGGAGPRHRRHPGHVRPVLHGRPAPHRLARHRPRLRLGRGASSTAPSRSGTVVALTAYLTRLYGPLTALSNVQIDVMTALVSFDRVFEVLDLPPMIDDKPDARPVPPGPARIEFDHVDFRYPTAEEVSLASLESVAVLDQHRLPARCSSTCPSPPSRASWWRWWARRGRARPPSASWSPGSTTCGSGAVRINGVDVRDATLESLTASIGVVTQDAHLFHETIRANLRLRQARRHRRRARCRPGRCADRHLVESLPDGLDTLVGDRGYRLSGGEKQRIAIARLLLKAPDIVVLDEATAHLDSESEVAVQTGPGHRPARSHLAGHRPPAVHRARGRHDPGPRRRSHRRTRSPRRAAGRRRCVRRAVPHPVRAPGAGSPLTG